MWPSCADCSKRYGPTPCSSPAISPTPTGRTGCANRRSTAPSPPSRRASHSPKCGCIAGRGRSGRSRKPTSSCRCRRTSCGARFWPSSSTNRRRTERSFPARRRIGWGCRSTTRWKPIAYSHQRSQSDERDDRPRTESGIGGGRVDIDLGDGEGEPVALGRGRRPGMFPGGRRRAPRATKDRGRHGLGRRLGTDRVHRDHVPRPPARFSGTRLRRRSLHDGGPGTAADPVLHRRGCGRGGSCHRPTGCEPAGRDPRRNRAGARGRARLRRGIPHRAAQAETGLGDSMADSAAALVPTPLERARADALSPPWHVWAVLVAATSAVVGVIWDISWHRTIGRDTFWTPAHMAIYASGIIAGVSCGWLVLKTTFAGDESDRATSVHFWGFRGPLGAWLCIWGALAMIVSAPFDN